MKKLRHWKLFITQKLSKLIRRKNKAIIHYIREWLGVNNIDVRLHFTRREVLDLMKEVKKMKRKIK